MLDLTPEGLRAVDELAGRHQVSSDAVLTLLRALVQGNGTQAQFNHPDLGGMGQWSQGGMIMVGDMFNHALKARVDALCRDLADLLRAQPGLASAGAGQSQSQSQGGGLAGVSLFVPGSASSGTWWPAELGSPASTGSQNELRYAYFPAARRLAILQGGRVGVYDTGEHRISGFSQQQSGDQSLTFTSQLGLVRVADLPLVSPTGPAPSDPAERAEGQSPSARPAVAAEEAPRPASPERPVEPVAARAPPAEDDIFTKIERLFELRQRNILTEDEFAAKKAELLSRL
jgi:hypothetical protein